MNSELQLLLLWAMRRKHRRKRVFEVRKPKFLTGNGSPRGRAPGIDLLKRGFFRGTEAEGARDHGSDVLEKFGDDGEAADDDAGGEFGVGPHAHGDHVVADVGGLDDFPSVVGA